MTFATCVIMMFVMEVIMMLTVEVATNVFNIRKNIGYQTGRCGNEIMAFVS